MQCLVVTGSLVLSCEHHLAPNPVWDLLRPAGCSGWKAALLLVYLHGGAEKGCRLRVMSGQHPAPVNLSAPSYWPSQWEDEAGSTLSSPCSCASHRLPGARHGEPLPTTLHLKSGLSFPSGLSLFLRRKRKVKIKERRGFCNA